MFARAWLNSTKAPVNRFRKNLSDSIVFVIATGHLPWGKWLAAETSDLIWTSYCDVCVWGWTVSHMDWWLIRWADGKMHVWENGDRNREVWMDEWTKGSNSGHWFLSLVLKSGGLSEWLPTELPIIHCTHCLQMVGISNGNLNSNTRISPEFLFIYAHFAFRWQKFDNMVTQQTWMRRMGCLTCLKLTVINNF